LHEIPVECLLGEDNLPFDAGGMEQINPVLHSRCKSNMLDIKVLSIRCNGDEVAITNPIL
jgi:hypothetical protein